MCKGLLGARFIRGSRKSFFLAMGAYKPFVGVLKASYETGEIHVFLSRGDQSRYQRTREEENGQNPGC